jgi:hypothetical protein
MTAGNRWRVGRDIVNDDAGGGDRLSPDPVVANVEKMIAFGLNSKPRRLDFDEIAEDLCLQESLTWKPMTSPQDPPIPIRGVPDLAIVMHFNALQLLSSLWRRHACSKKYPADRPFSADLAQTSNAGSKVHHQRV